MAPDDEASVQHNGHIRLRSPVQLEPGANVFVSIPQVGGDTAIAVLALSEHALAEDWLKEEEDEAWAHL
jgi:hypothetical protein